MMIILHLIRGGKKHDSATIKSCFLFFFGLLVFWFFGFFVYNLKKRKKKNAYIVHCSAFINTQLLSQSPQIIK